MIKGKFFTDDGELVFIQDASDLANLVERRIGYDAGRLVKELADLADSTKQRLDSDLIAYESELESNRAAFEEIHVQVSRLLNIVHRAKIAKEIKETMLTSLETIRKEVSNQI